MKRRRERLDPRWHVDKLPLVVSLAMVVTAQPQRLRASETITAGTFLLGLAARRRLGEARRWR